MQNNFLIEGPSYFEIEKEIQRIIDVRSFNEATKSSYDMEETTLDSALEDLDTYSFLSTKKVIIISNIENISKEESSHKLNHLYRYLDNPSSDNLLFIWSTKFNNTLKITKELKKRMDFITTEININKYVKDKFKGYKISSELIDYLLEKCQNDLAKITNEIDKLRNYKLDEKEITKQDIDELVTEKLKDQQDLVFKLTKYIAQKDKKEALNIYFELLSYSIEPLAIIGLIASQIRIIYQVKIMQNQRLSSEEIAKLLGEKSSYRVKKTKELIGYYSEDELLLLMKKLANMDLKIKTTDSDPNNLIELFILDL